jgi:small subunit ribosomal protein S16
MAVRIRLMRMGSKRRPFYRFVVADSRGKRDGGFLDQVGYYNPIEKPLKIEVDEEKIFDWMSKGAQLTDGTRSLLKKAGTLARWDAKRTGREAPDKSLAAAEARVEVAAEEVEAAPSVEEARTEEAVAAEAASEKPAEEEAVPEDSGAAPADTAAEDDAGKTGSV